MRTLLLPLALGMLSSFSPGKARAEIHSYVPAAYAAAPVLRQAELASYEGELYPVRIDGTLCLEAQAATRWQRDRLLSHFRDWARGQGLACHEDPLPPEALHGRSAEQGLRLLRIGARNSPTAATLSLLPAGENGETLFRLLLPPSRPGLEADYPPVLDSFPEVAALSGALSLDEAWRKESFFDERVNLSLLLKAPQGNASSGEALLLRARERLVASGWEDLASGRSNKGSESSGNGTLDSAPRQLMLKRPGWTLLLFASGTARPTLLLTLATSSRQATTASQP